MLEYNLGESVAVDIAQLFTESFKTSIYSGLDRRLKAYVWDKLYDGLEDSLWESLRNNIDYSLEYKF